MVQKKKMCIYIYQCLLYTIKKREILIKNRYYTTAFNSQKIEILLIWYFAKRILQENKFSVIYQKQISQTNRVFNARTDNSCIWTS